MQNLMLVITIAKRSMSEDFISYYQQENVPLTLGRYGRGTANQEMLNYLGVGEKEKCVLFSIIPYTKAKMLLPVIERKMGLAYIGNGLVFSIPMKSVGGLTAYQYLGGEEVKEEGEKMAMNYENELVIVIANRGYVDVVMEVAREAGANGGTVVHARGTGSDQSETFFGVTMGAEKEMIFIVTSKEKRVSIMKAIMEKAGTSSEAQSVVFSLPVNDVVGMSTKD